MPSNTGPTICGTDARQLREVSATVSPDYIKERFRVPFQFHGSDARKRRHGCGREGTPSGERSQGRIGEDDIVRNLLFACELRPAGLERVEEVCVSFGHRA